jgi:ankyrin repeat protein
MKSFLIIISIFLMACTSLNASFNPYWPGQDQNHRHMCINSYVSLDKPYQNWPEQYNRRMSSDGFLLLKAAKHGDLQQVKSLIHARGIDVNEQDPITGEFPLLLAVWRDQANVVRTLLDAPHINPTQHDRGGHTAYWWAKFASNEVIMNMMTIDRRKLALAMALHPRCGAKSAANCLKRMLEYIWKLSDKLEWKIVKQ